MTPRSAYPTTSLHLVEGDELLRLLRGKAYAGAVAASLKALDEELSSRVRAAVEAVGDDGELEAGPVVASVGRAVTRRRWKLREGVVVPDEFVSRSSATYVTSPANKAATRGNDAVFNNQLAGLRATQERTMSSVDKVTHPEPLTVWLANTRATKAEVEAEGEAWRDSVHAELERRFPGTLRTVAEGTRVRFESHRGIVGWVADIRVQSRVDVEGFLAATFGEDDGRWLELAAPVESESRGALRVKEASL